MESHEILPLEEDTKATLIEVALRLRPHRDELVQRWSQAFRFSVLRQHSRAEKNSELIVKAVVDLFLQHVGEGRLDDYLNEISALSEEYIGAGLKYENLILAMHLYEEASMPLLMREYPDSKEMMDVLIAQDHLYHNVLILVAATYFQRLNAEIEARATQLQESYQRHEEFVAMVAHELRSPLSSILGYLQLSIQASERGQEINVDMLKRAFAQAKRLKRLMEDLQDASSISMGRFKMRKEACDLIAIVRESVRQLSIAAPSHTLSVQAPESLPLTCDPDRIAQVVDNLVGNAVKYSLDGSKTTVIVSVADGEAAIGVQDQGIGISEEDMPFLFQPFSRLYRQTRAKGTGLGLYISRAIVEAHGGRIWAESQPQAGSKFSVSLPLDRPSEEHQPR